MCVPIPIKLCRVLMLWLGLGLGRKPEERPEVVEGERDGAALLLAVLSGLLEVEQPRVDSCGTEQQLLTYCKKAFVGFV